MMRLFIAINLNEPMKREVLRVMDWLRHRQVRGNFTRPENLHLTLLFLGEIPTSRVQAIKQALNQIKHPNFQMTLSGTGNYSNLLWMGIEKSAELDRLQSQIVRAMRSLDLPIEQRAFKPHLTVCRQAQIPERLDSNELIGLAERSSMEVTHFDLMQSNRVNGRMVYIPIHTIELQSSDQQ